MKETTSLRQIEANRLNAQKSTGLRHGFCSPAYRRFWLALLEAPPGYPVANTVRAMLTPEESCHPVYADLIDVHFEIEMEDRAYSQRVRRQSARQGLRDPERSLEPTENKDYSKN